MTYLFALRRTLLLAIGVPLSACGGIAIVDDGGEGGEGGAGGQGTTTSTGTTCLAAAKLTACVDDVAMCPAIGSPNLEQSLASWLNQNQLCEEQSEFCSCSWKVEAINCVLPGTGCCYDVTANYDVICEGLPFMIDGTARTASVRARTDWSSQVRVSLEGVTLEQRRAIAALWQRDATYEHASIASFARLVLELLAFGAPPELVNDASRAIADEARHARAAFGLASALSGDPVGPGELSLHHALDHRLEIASFVRAIVREGCIGETISAAIAARARECVTDNGSLRVLEMIAEDEAAHAALSFRVLKFCVERFGEVAIRAAREEFKNPPSFTRDDRGLDANLAHRFGQLLPSEQCEVAERTYRDLVEPILRETLSLPTTVTASPS